MKPEQERVKNLLTDTVTLLCKNGLHYGKEMKVQGLLGITLDEEEVFVVHINERFNGLVGVPATGVQVEGGTAVSQAAAAHSTSSDKEPESTPGISAPSSVPHRTPRKSPKIDKPVRIKTERVEEDVLIVEPNPKREPPDDMPVLNFDPSVSLPTGGQGGDRDIMQQSYGFSEAEGPPAKKRAPQFPGIRTASSSSMSSANISRDSGTLFASGFEQNVHPNIDRTCDKNSLMQDAPSLEDSAPGIDNVPGSSWDPNSSKDSSHPGTSEDADAQDTVLHVIAPGEMAETQHPDPRHHQTIMDPSAVQNLQSAQEGCYQSVTASWPQMARVRRPRDRLREKSFYCTYEGCTRAFYHRGDLYRHERINHGVPVGYHQQHTSDHSFPLTDRNT